MTVTPCSRGWEDRQGSSKAQDGSRLEAESALLGRLGQDQPLLSLLIPFKPKQRPTPKW